MASRVRSSPVFASHTKTRRGQIHYFVAVIGAGPYGLALAAELKAANVDFVLFGETMGFWRRNVPIGTRLISGPISCSLSRNRFHCLEYVLHNGGSPGAPCTAEQFIAYGEWFQREFCGSPDPRRVIHVARLNGAYELRLSDGSRVTSDCVVIATGLRPFAAIPAQFAELRNGSILHTSDLHSLEGFSGKRVAVVGCGQSAIDCAALLSEQNAEVEVLARSAQVWWTGELSAPAVRPRKSLKSVIKQAGCDLLCEPDVHRMLPWVARKRVLEWLMRPVAQKNLVPRLDAVRFGLGRTITGVSVQKDTIKLELDDGTTRTVDYVVLGTGYRVDVDAMQFLSAGLRAQIRRHAGYPELNNKMESSAPGLYFIGAAAVCKFGRAMWLVRGARWAAARVSVDVIRQQKADRATAGRLEATAARTLGPET